MCYLNSTSTATESGSVKKKRKRVVVVGGGIAGALITKTIQFDADVVLIDEKEYFEISWASLRSMVEPTFAERTLINHKDYFVNGTVIASSAVNITETEVTTAQGDTVPYDYLVIATGHKDSSTKTRTEKLTQYREEYEMIRSSDSILIVGGGPTGVELAAEIMVDFPAKKVTLVHRGSRLLEFIGPKASKKALDWLAAKKVEVILEQTVTMTSSPEGTTYQTSGGETILADCHFVCTGKPSASSWLKRTLLNKSLNTQGKVMVDEHLRVRGYKNIFAIGDITDLQEIKQGYLAQAHALLTAKNLKALIMGKEESKLGSYKAGSNLAFVSLGRREAVAQLPFATVSGCIPGSIKSGDLFVGKTRKQLGLKSNPT